jgi:hypothetical protein
MNGSEKFKKLLIVPQKVYSEWKRALMDENNLSYFDKLIKGVLRKKNLTDDEKWNLYKYQLMKYNNFKRGIENRKNKKRVDYNPPQSQSHPKVIPTRNDDFDLKIPTATSSAFNTPINIKNRRSTLLIPQQQKRENFVGFRDDLPNNNGIMEEKIFEHNPQEQDYDKFESELNRNDDAIADDDDAVGDDRFLAREKFNFDDELEFEFHKKAQRELESAHPNDVVRKDNTLGKEYRAFEDRQTGDYTIVEVEPIKNRLAEKVLNSLRRDEYSQMDISAAPETSIPAVARAREVFNLKRNISKNQTFGEHSERHGYNLRKRAKKNKTPEKPAQRKVNRKYRDQKQRWLSLRNLK